MRIPVHEGVDELLKTLVGQFNPDDFYRRLATFVTSHIDYDFFRVTIRPPHEPYLQVPFLTFGDRLVTGLPTMLAVDESLPGEALRSGDIVRRDRESVETRYGDEHILFSDIGLAVLLSIPLPSRGQLIGTLDVGFREVSSAGDATVAALREVAAGVGMLVEHAWLLQEHWSLAKIEERHQVAREIHDTVVQSLISILLQLEIAQRRIRVDPASARAELAQACEAARECLEDGRRLVLNLEPVSRGRASLVAVLRREIDELRHAGIEAEFLVRGAARPLDGKIEMAVFRIAQRLIAAIRRQARATSVKAALAYGIDAIELTITEESAEIIPAAVGQRRAVAVRELDEEARAVDGVVRLLPAGDRARLITVRIPVPSSHEAAFQEPDLARSLNASPKGAPAGASAAADRRSVAFSTRDSLRPGELAGEHAVTPFRVAGASAGQRRLTFHDDGVTERLTEREEQVLALVARGRRNKEIARELTLAEATVKYHVAHLLMKLAVSSRTEALVKAQALGLVS